MDELVEWLRAQLDEDERWALACNRPYEYAVEGSTAPAAGVHWRWVAGDHWETVTPDPVLDEFVAQPGMSCNLATVEEWPVRTGWLMPRTYANDIIEMDSAAAGHIARWDPSRVLREVEAKRRLIDYADQAHEDNPWVGWRQVIVLLALPYSDRPGYRDEWRPA